jgi:hypothetical protein
LNPSRTVILFFSLSAVCIISVFGILYNFFIANPKPETAAAAEIISVYTVSDLIDSALKAEIIIPKANFVSETSSPFRPLDFQPARSVSQAIVKAPITPQRIPLRLKGLMRNPPLVIVEDARGETHIKAQGDNIRSTLIVSIGSNSAVFKDSSGTYELMVEENR